MRQWAKMSSETRDYIIRSYGANTPVKKIADSLSITTDRVKRVLQMNDVPILSKSDFYKKLNSDRYEFEDELIKDYQGGMELVPIQRKYNIGRKKVHFILERNDIPRRHHSEALRMLWRTGKRKPVESNKGGSKNIWGGLVDRWRRNAASRSYPFTLTPTYLQEMLERQNFRCAYTGIEMVCPSYYSGYHSVKGDWRMISLDRIDANRGYVDGNVHFVTVFANRAKGAMCDSEFRQTLKELIAEARGVV
jgi:hypothetical protein